jgi:NitT/TauT family transport system ATP-binding protein
MLTVSNIEFAYAEGNKVLDGISLELRTGEIVSLLGTSGCGKSSLLKIIAGLEEADSGDIIGANNVSFVFQEPALLPWSTVAENIALPISLKSKRVNAQVLSALESVGLDQMKDRYPATLSGGQKMRASIARALVTETDLMLMDEPFAALDEILRFKMNDLLLKLQAKENWSVLFVTHSIYEAVYISDRVLVMDQGKIIGDIAPELDPALSPEERRASQSFAEAVKKVSALMQKVAKKPASIGGGA